MKRILVPVDGSAGARRAASFAATLAKDTGATLELMYVYDAPTASAMGLRAAESIADVKAQVATGSFNAALAEIDTDAVAVAEHVAIGHPVEEIVGYAKEQGHDLVCMGSRGMSEVKELLLGSVSQKVAHHATCPVLLVR